jgi:transcriptional regulator with XRE-family HTH domain
LPLDTAGARVRWALAQRGMSASALARRLGLSRAAVSYWWTQQSSPYKWIQQLSEILEVRGEWLLTGHGEIERSDPWPRLADWRHGRATPALIGVPLVGIAEAEVWREGAPPDLVGLEQFAFEVRGGAVDRSLHAGEYALAVPYARMRPRGPQGGDLVVALKRREPNEHKILIARLAERDGEWELRYESHEPRWQQPLRLSADLIRDAGDDLPIAILGLIYGVLRCDPRPFEAARPRPPG